MSSICPTEMLRGIPLFQNLTTQEMEELRGLVEEPDYKAGEVIFREGGRDRALYVILDGEVEILLPAPAFQETVVATLGAGSVFGESTFFHAAPHATTARCLKAVLALRLRREQYELLLHQRSPAAYKIAANAAEILGGRLQQTDRWMEDILQERQDAAIAASWREFRRRRGFTFEPQRWGP